MKLVFLYVLALQGAASSTPGGGDRSKGRHTREERRAGATERIARASKCRGRGESGKRDG